MYFQPQPQYAPQRPPWPQYQQPQQQWMPPAAQMPLYSSAPLRPAPPQYQPQQRAWKTYAGAVAIGVAAFVILPTFALTTAPKSEVGQALQQATTATTIVTAAPQTTTIQPVAETPTTTAAPVVQASSATTAPPEGDVNVGGTLLIGCKPKPGVDIPAFWAGYTKGGGSPNWEFVRGKVCK